MKLTRLQGWSEAGSGHHQTVIEYSTSQYCL